MAEVLGREIGFAITVRTYVYDTEPSEPPTENPRGYDMASLGRASSESRSASRAVRSRINRRTATAAGRGQDLRGLGPRSRGAV